MELSSESSVMLDPIAHRARRARSLIGHTRGSWREVTEDDVCGRLVTVLHNGHRKLTDDVQEDDG